MSDTAPPAEISYDDFLKVDIRAGRVLSAERVPKSDKLLRLSVDLGEPEPRQVLAGIGLSFQPEAVAGKTLAFVANLPPRKMMGLESRGMVLAAGDAAALSLVEVHPAPAPGSRLG